LKNVPGLIASLLALLGCAHAAQQPFQGPDLSGVYTCQGQDAKEGEYSATATLELNPAHSVGIHGAYTFRLDVPGYGAYPGHAATQGTQAAIYFANTDPATQDYGTGVATFKKNKQGKWTFRKYYYEPAFKGGNHGFEVCTQR
jgi:predicted dehydrogenase